MVFRVEKSKNQTPLHYAFKNGNLEVALWIIQIVRKNQGQEAYAEILNSIDLVSKNSLKHLGRYAPNRLDGIQD
jgi:hypothetical protein